MDHTTINFHNDAHIYNDTRICENRLCTEDRLDGRLCTDRSSTDDIANDDLIDDIQNMKYLYRLKVIMVILFFILIFGVALLIILL